MLLSTRIYFTALVSIIIWSLLGWAHYHGGVPSHHVLAREDLPLISNWWGAILLPVLTWLLLLRIHIRLQKNVDRKTSALPPATVLWAFLAALLFGATLAATFSFGYEEIPGNMLMALFVLALFLPVYRAECLLGFVLSMTYTFGAVLPAVIGGLLVLMTVIIYRVLRPALLMFSKFIRGIFSKDVVGH